MRTIDTIKRDIADTQAHLDGSVKGSGALSDASRKALYGHRIAALNVELAQAEARRVALMKVAGG